VQLDRNLYDRDATPGQVEVRRQVLQALKNTTNLSLQTPNLAGAILITREAKSVMRIWWIEDSPSIDGLEIRLKNGIRQARFALDKGVLDEMRREDARFAIIFSHIQELPSDMGEIDGNIQCTLTRGGVVVTPYVQVVRDEPTSTPTPPAGPWR